MSNITRDSSNILKTLISPITKNASRWLISHFGSLESSATKRTPAACSYFCDDSQSALARIVGRPHLFRTNLRESFRHNYPWRREGGCREQCLGTETTSFGFEAVGPVPRQASDCS